MPDFTIPGALLISVGATILLIFAMHSGNWEYSAIAGVIAAWVNFICFFRRCLLQEKLVSRRSLKSN